MLALHRLQRVREYGGVGVHHDVAGLQVREHARECLHDGRATELDGAPQRRPQRIVSQSQASASVSVKTECRAHLEPEQPHKLERVGVDHRVACRDGLHQLRLDVLRKVLLEVDPRVDVGDATLKMGARAGGRAGRSENVTSRMSLLAAGAVVRTAAIVLRMASAMTTLMAVSLACQFAVGLAWYC